MITINYTPLREIVGGPGVVAGAGEVFDYSPKFFGKQFESLDGTMVSTLHRYETGYALQIEAQDATQIKKWREFAASCTNAETFQLDARNIPDGPDSVITCRLVKNSYKESRFGAYLSPSFKVIRVS
ncbi:hypothetical protein [Pleionea sediminis]|uniref:hypothetical protein n=1 Tax=Pleionea sediminis TaxID=2569479 RepID=UPI0011852228|nr:hypothetical protein [Pleionea sediminis]